VDDEGDRRHHDAGPATSRLVSADVLPHPRDVGGPAGWQGARLKEEDLIDDVVHTSSQRPSAPVL